MAFKFIARSIYGWWRPLVVLLSLAMFGVTVTFWVRSYYTIDEVLLKRGRSYLLDTVPGGVQLAAAWRYKIIRTKGEPDIFEFQPRADHWHIESVFSAGPPDDPPQNTFLGFGYERLEGSTGNIAGVPIGRLRSRTLTLPFWFGCCFWLLAPAASALRGVRRRRARRRLLANRCQSCGYDLRATPDRCPECGSPATARTRVLKSVRS